MNLATFVAEPSFVLIGDIPTPVPRLRVRDIAILENYFLEVFPEPIPGELEKPLWPVRLGSEVAGRLLGTPEGTARILHAAIHGINPHYSIEDARIARSIMKDEEIATVFAAAFPVPRPSQAKPLSPSPDRPCVDWVALIRRLCRELHCPPAVCLDMPIDQFLGSFESDDEDDRLVIRSRKKWAVPIRSPEQMAKLWTEHQAKNS